MLVRVTTGVEAHTHQFMATAHDDQKFGFSLASGAADEAVRRVIACPGLVFAGLHSHIGSQIFARRASRWPRTGWSGWPSGSETSTASRSPSSTWAAGSASPIPTRMTPPRSRSSRRACATSGRPVPGGRAGPAAADRRAGPRHRRPVHRVAVHGRHDQGRGRAAHLRQRGRRDGDNIRTALYDASYVCALASRASAAPPMLSRVVGRHCERGDIVVRHASLPADLAPGDLLAVPPPAPTAGRWPATTTTSPARRWSRSARARPGPSSPRDPRRPAQPGLRMNQTLPTLKIALLGCGVVGTDVARLLTEQADDLALRVGARLELAGIAVRRVGHRRSATIDRSLLTADSLALATRPDVDTGEVIGGIEPAGHCCSPR